jgi:hypothetical protein
MFNYLLVVKGSIRIYAARTVLHFVRQRKTSGKAMVFRRFLGGRDLG